MSATSIQLARPQRRIGAWTSRAIFAAAFFAAGSVKLGAAATHVFVLHTAPLGGQANP